MSKFIFKKEILSLFLIDLKKLKQKEEMGKTQCQIRRLRQNVFHPQVKVCLLETQQNGSVQERGHLQVCGGTLFLLL